MAKKETTVTVKRSIMMELSLEEVSKMAHQMADTMTEIKALEDELKAASTDFKDRIKGKEVEMNALKDQIQAGERSIILECDRVKNFEKGVIEFWHDGKIIEEETMTASDHQADLEFDENANAEEAKRIEEIESPEKEEELQEELKLTKQQKARFRELFNAAIVATKERRFDDAVDLFNDALEIKPNDEKSIERKNQLRPFLTKEPK